MRSWNQYREAGASLALWRLASGIEVDFIVNEMKAAIEVKAARKITFDHFKGLRHLRQDLPEVGRLVLVCLEEQAWRSDDGIDVLPVRDFLLRLWAGEMLRGGSAVKNVLITGASGFIGRDLSVALGRRKDVLLRTTTWRWRPTVSVDC